jgi:hypothetical protein
MRHPQPSQRQPDLFAPDAPPVALAAAELAMLMPLVSVLLTETVMTAPATERANEDHV